MFVNIQLHSIFKNFSSNIFFLIIVIDPRSRAKGEGKRRWIKDRGHSSHARAFETGEKKREKRGLNTACGTGWGEGLQRGGEGGAIGGRFGQRRPWATCHSRSALFTSLRLVFFEPSLHTRGVEEDPIVSRPTTPFVSILPARLHHSLNPSPFPKRFVETAPAKWALLVQRHSICLGSLWNFRLCFV